MEIKMWKRAAEQAPARKGMLPGAYTVESAILVSLILLLLMTWFYLAFSFHDRLVYRALALFYMEGAGRMLAEPVSEEGRLEIERLNEKEGYLANSYVSRIKTSVFENRFNTASEGLLLISHPGTFRMSAGATAVQVNYASDTRIPTVLPELAALSGDVGSSGQINYKVIVTPKTFVRAARVVLWRE